MKTNYFRMILLNKILKRMWAKYKEYFVSDFESSDLDGFFYPEDFACLYWGDSRILKVVPNTSSRVPEMSYGNTIAAECLIAPEIYNKLNFSMQKIHLNFCKYFNFQILKNKISQIPININKHSVIKAPHYDIQFEWPRQNIIVSNSKNLNEFSKQLNCRNEFSKKLNWRKLYVVQDPAVFVTSVATGLLVSLIIKKFNKVTLKGFRRSFLKFKIYTEKENEKYKLMKKDKLFYLKKIYITYQEFLRLLGKFRNNLLTAEEKKRLKRLLKQMVKNIVLFVISLLFFVYIYRRRHMLIQLLKNFLKSNETEVDKGMGEMYRKKKILEKAAKNPGVLKKQVSDRLKKSRQEIIEDVWSDSDIIVIHP